MTREPFIAHSELTNEIYIVVGKEKYRVTEQAIKAVIAIKALEQEDILGKIRDEILEEKEWAYADFERYKVEYLGQDWEDALDGLPQDDFRYGMERAIEIIDKCRRSE